MKQLTITLAIIMVSGSVFASRGGQATTTRSSNASRVAEEPVQNKTECARLHSGGLLDSTAAVSKTRTAKAGATVDGRD